MKALTVCQPWATAILTLGKAVENRTWSTPYRGPLAIHAGKSRRWYDAEDPEDWPDLYGVELPPLESLTLGCVLGVVDLLDCVPLAELGRRYPDLRGHAWAEGPVCWVLANPRLLAEPVPYSGQQGLWQISDGLLKF